MESDPNAQTSSDPVKQQRNKDPLQLKTKAATAPRGRGPGKIAVFQFIWLFNLA